MWRARGGTERAVTDVPVAQAIVSWHVVRLPSCSPDPLMHGGSPGPFSRPSFPEALGSGAFWHRPCRGRAAHHGCLQVGAKLPAVSP